MIISQKCNCCLHEEVCSLKEDYLSACAAVKESSYATKERGIMRVKDSKFDVHIKCPNQLTESAILR